MLDTLSMIQALCDIAEQEGPEITETETRNQGERCGGQSTRLRR